MLAPFSCCLGLHSIVDKFDELLLRDPRLVKEIDERRKAQGLTKDVLKKKVSMHACQERKACEPLQVQTLMQSW